MSAPEADPALPDIPSADREFDVVLIGTSPIMMINALHFRFQGLRVAVVERCGHFGGSWYTRDLWGYEGLEMGSHVLRNRRQVYRFFDRVLGVPIAPPDWRAFGILGGRRLPLPLYRAINYGRGFLLDLRARRFAAARESGIMFARAFANLPVGFRYPKQGCRVIVSHLAELMERAGIEILLETEIREIDISADRTRGVCQTSAGDIGFERIVLGQCAHSPLRLAGEKFEIEAHPKTSTNALLLLEGVKAHPFSYFESREDPILKRVRDVGDFPEKRLPEGHTLLVAHVERKVFLRHAEEASFVEAVVARLVELGLMAPGCRAVRANLDHHELVKLEPAEMERVRAALSPAVVGLLTWDLGEELTSLLGQPGRLAVPPQV